MIYVLHHADQDGRFGGFAAWKSFGSIFTTKELLEANTRFIEVQYGQNFPIPIEELKREDTVYVIDFSYAREILDEVYAKVLKLVVLDHHATAEKQLAGTPYGFFDKTKSGALIAWEYFHPTAPIPKVCLLVNDYDLWKKEYGDDSVILEAWLQHEKIGQQWYWWNKLTYEPSYLMQALAKGKILHEHNTSIVNSFVKNEENYVIRDLIKIDDHNTTTHKYAIYNGNSILRNEIAEALYTRHNLDLTIQWRVRANKIVFSVRAPNPERIAAHDFCADVLNGGGNPKAAGAGLTLVEGFEVIQKLMTGRL